MIFCRHCGTSNVDHASFCTACGQPIKEPASGEGQALPDAGSAPYSQPPETGRPQYSQPPEAQRTHAQPHPHAGGYYGGQGAPPPQVKNWLVEAIIATICCCVPLGVVSIIFAAQVNTKLAQGDYAGAVSSSNNARLFFILALVLGLIANIAAFALNFAAIMAEMGTGGF
ncbi:MAG: CD225/dispanin family protein [bacterium]|jgi:hypothetical protein